MRPMGIPIGIKAAPTAVQRLPTCLEEVRQPPGLLERVRDVAVYGRLIQVTYSTLLADSS